MTTASILLLLVLFQIKHVLLDFRFQPPFMWMNKGTWGHPGGIVHSQLHAIATWIILLWFTTPPVAIALASAEFVVHYLVDFAKMNINRIKGWKCNEHPEFWYLTGYDQFLHQLTYLAIIAVVAL